MLYNKINYGYLNGTEAFEFTVWEVLLRPLSIKISQTFSQLFALTAYYCQLLEQFYCLNWLWGWSIIRVNYIQSRQPIQWLNSKQLLLDEVFVISRIIEVEVRVISRSRRFNLITFTETLIILNITKTKSNNYYRPAMCAESFFYLALCKILFPELRSPWPAVRKRDL